MVNQVGREKMLKMLKPAGPGICTCGGNGKTVTCGKMESWQARESENLPIYRYQWANLWIYQSTNQATDLEMYQFTNLPIYQSANLSGYQPISLPIYQSTALSIYPPMYGSTNRAIDLPT